MDETHTDPVDLRPIEQSTFSAYVPEQPPVKAPVEASRPPQPATTSHEEAPRRRVSVMLFVLVFTIGLLMIPWLSEQIAYSVNRGKERAKADVARRLLAEMPQAEQRIPWVAKLVAPTVVGIRTVSPGRHGGVGMESGSGVIVDVDGEIGYILTNDHVIANAHIVMVYLNDGRVIDEAEIVGRDPATDLAVLRIDSPGLSMIAWGDSSRVEVGDQVIAIGNPYDLSQTVTSGIISATERFNPVPSKSRVQEFLQTDAAINPGNSGGPLVDMKGELIGINTAIFSQTGGSVGIGFAIPSLMARKVYDEIRKHGNVKHGWLGVSIRPPSPSDAARMKIDKPAGAVIAGFFPRSPAEKAGIQVGDIILRWGETEIRDPLHLTHVIVLARPGDVQTVEVFRNNERIKLEIELGTRPVELD